MKQSARNNGFTLIEILVVVSLISILAVVGVVAYRTVISSARDAERRSDVAAIAKAYEMKKSNSGSYSVLTDSDFASGGKPIPPEGGTYFSVTDGSGTKACAVLEANPSGSCNTSAVNCYCVTSSQGTITNPQALQGDHYDLGVGGENSPSCDSNGTLLSGIVGYWKMDEVDTPFVDSSQSHKNVDWIVPTPGAITSYSFPYPTGSIPRPGSRRVANFNSAKLGTAVNSSGGFLPTGNSKRTIAFWFLSNGGWNQRVAVGYGCGSAEGPKCTGITEGKYVGAWATQSQTNAIPPVNTSRMGINLGTSPNCTLTGPPLELNSTKWHLYTAVFNGDNNTVTFYLDGGAATQTVTVPGGCNGGAIDTFSGSGISLGGGAADGGYYGGFLDDVRIYNRALSSTEISALWNGGNGCIP